MNACIITVGTELVEGYTVDSHSSFLSRELFVLGIGVKIHITVRDNFKDIVSAVCFGQEKADLIILCGGLGPTEDDITKETLASFLNEELVIAESLKEHIEKFFNSSMPSSNYKQAFVFKNGVFFKNSLGTAPGLFLAKAGKKYLLLPGPPHELENIFNLSVIPFLKELDCVKKTIFSNTILSIFGVKESIVESLIKGLNLEKSILVATYTDGTEIFLHLVLKDATGFAKTFFNKCIKSVRDSLKPYCYSYGAKRRYLEEEAIFLLQKSKKSLAVCESCSGGKLAHLLSTVPGSSNVFKGGIVAYTNEIKERLVDVPKEILVKYGAVSKETAELLAKNTLGKFKTDFALSITGIAGPTVIENKPKGLVYICLATTNGDLFVKKYIFTGTREYNQKLSAKNALWLLINFLNGNIKNFLA